MSTSLSNPTSLLSTSSSATPASLSMGSSQHEKDLVWQTAVYLVVVFVIVAIITSTIVLVGRSDWTISTPSSRPSKMESSGSDSAFYLPSASVLVREMFRYFFATLLPAFRHLGRAATATATTTTTTLLSGAARRQPVLPLFRPAGFREPVLTAPRPVMPRDSSSFRVPSNPYSGSESSSLPTIPLPTPLP